MVDLDGCWLWQGYQMPNGYCQVRRGDKAWLAHRYAYLLANGELDNDLKVCHSCDVRNCVNPAHLWQGTQRENLNDARTKGRMTDFGDVKPDNRGENQGRATLTNEQAEEVYFLKDTGVSQQFVGSLFGVDRRTVGRVWRKETWAHLHE